MAKDYFDFELVEILRGSGEWHWELDMERIEDIAESVADHLGDGEKGADGLYTILREYYGEQYRTPSDEELDALGIPKKTAKDDDEDE
jgi:hypothetical protein